MNRKMILIPVIVLTLASLACSVTINAPNIELATGKTVTETITVPLPVDKTTPSNITVEFGAGTIKLQPGATDALVSGTAKYNVDQLKPVVTADANGVKISQENLKLNRLPSLTSKVVNEWDLLLANSTMNLIIKAGAYSGNYELGGLSISQLEVTDGAAKVNLSFSKPNQAQMSTLKYSTGASEVTVNGLGNANVSDVSFSGGAGSYILDFSGQLQRDMTVSVDSGVSSVTLRVPAGVPAQVTSESSLISVTSSGNWQQQGTTYQQSGTGYKIIILVKMGAGSLQLENSM
jgi:hypothetical protein